MRDYLSSTMNNYLNQLKDLHRRERIVRETGGIPNAEDRRKIEEIRKNLNENYGAPQCQVKNLRVSKRILLS